MKLTYLNKTVEINIPSTTKRLKQQVLEDFFDSYKDADKEPYENEEFLFKLGSFEGSSDIEEIPVNVIGQWMSGGADSSLLAYLLCKKIRDEKLDIKFQPISVRRGRPNNPIYAGNVIDFIEEELGVDFILPHEVYYPPLDDEYMREIKIFWEITFTEKLKVQIPVAKQNKTFSIKTFFFLMRQHYPRDRWVRAQPVGYS